MSPEPLITNVLLYLHLHVMASEEARLPSRADPVDSDDVWPTTKPVSTKHGTEAAMLKIVTGEHSLEPDA